MKTFLKNNQEHINSLFIFLNSNKLEFTEDNVLKWVKSTTTKMSKLIENDKFRNDMYTNYKNN